MQLSVFTKKQMEFAQPKVLIVDDDFGTLELFSALLETMGCQVEVALNGQIAIEKLKQNQFDLMILDWQMPHMNGQETLEKINSLKNLNLMNYVLYTSTEPMFICLPHTQNARFMDFWRKDTRVKKLRKRIQSVIRRARRAV